MNKSFKLSLYLFLLLAVGIFSPQIAKASWYLSTDKKIKGFQEKKSTELYNSVLKQLEAKIPLNTNNLVLNIKDINIAISEILLKEGFKLKSSEFKPLSESFNKRVILDTNKTYIYQSLKEDLLAARLTEKSLELRKKLHAKYLVDLSDYMKLELEYDSALLALEEADKLSPDNRVILAKQIDVLNSYDKADLNKLIKIYQRLVKLDGDKAEFHSEIAALYEDLGSIDKALIEVDLALKLDPKHKDAHIRKAIIQESQGKYTEAINSFIKAEESEEAKILIEKALKQNPKDPALLKLKASLKS